MSGTVAQLSPRDKSAYQYWYGWHRQFTEADLKAPLPMRLRISSERVLFRPSISNWGSCNKTQNPFAKWMCKILRIPQSARP